MENLNKTVAVSKKPTASAIAGSFKATAEAIVAGDLSVETIALDLNAYFADAWYEISNAKDATEGDGKELWTKFQKPFYKALDDAYTAKKGKPYSNKSTVWARIKATAKQLREGTKQVGQRKEKSPEERLLVAVQPRWSEYARMEAQTKRQAEIQDLLSQLILKIGHDPQKVDLKKLGLTK